MACNGPKLRITAGVDSLISALLQTTFRAHPSRPLVRSCHASLRPQHRKLSCLRHADAAPRLRRPVFGMFLHVSESRPTAQPSASLLFTAIGRRQRCHTARVWIVDKLSNLLDEVRRSMGSPRLRLTHFVGFTTALPPSDDPVTGCLGVPGPSRPGSFRPEKEAGYSRRSSQHKGSG